MYCLLPALFASYLGETPAPYRFAWTPPPQVDGLRRRGPKAICGNSFPYHIETEHFTVQWTNAAIPEERAQAIADALELGWEELVEEQGWPAPVSSDACYLWVILDDELSGSGLTTQYTSEDYPQGYPVSYLNPAFEPETPEFALSVAVHEFGHMIQYGLDGWDGTGTRAWFWEATAEWMAEKGLPEANTYAESTYWYARSPEFDYHTMKNFHQYGMLLLDAWIDENHGMEPILSAWLDAREHANEDWDARLARSVGMDFPEIVRQFTAAYAAKTLRESSLYYEPTLANSHRELPEEERLDIEGLYGSFYVSFAGGGSDLGVEGDVVVAYVQGSSWTDEPPSSGPFTAIFTSLTDQGTILYGSQVGNKDSDPGESGIPDSPGEDSEDSTKKEEPKACGCEGGAGVLALGLVAPLLLRRRR